MKVFSMSFLWAFLIRLMMSVSPTEVFLGFTFVSSELMKRPDLILKMDVRGLRTNNLANKIAEACWDVRFSM